MRAALAAAILGFVPGLLDPFNAAKAAALRVIGLPLLALVGVEALGRPLRSARVLDLAVIAWVIAAAASTAFGISPRLSLIGEIEQREGLLTVLSLAGLYAATRRSHREAGHVRGTLNFVIACAALAAVYAMLQRAGLDPVMWEDEPSYPVGEGRVIRVFATLGNPILLGAVLAAALAAGLARAFAPSRRSPWLLASLVLIACAIAATLSRGAALAAGVGVAAALAAALGRWGKSVTRRCATTLAWVAAPAALWTLLALRAPLLARIAESANPRAESSPARIEMALSALAIWRAHPWLGAGPDAFGLAFPAAQTSEFWRNSWLGNPAHAHSVPLQAMATGGAITVAIGCVWMVALVAGLVSRREIAGTSTGRGDAAASGGVAAAALPAPDTDADASRVAILAAVAALAAAGLVNPVSLAGAAIFVVLSASAAALAEGSRGDAVISGNGMARLTAIAVAGILALVLALGAWREVQAFAAASRARGALIESTRAPVEHQVVLARIATERARRATELAPGEDELWRLRCDAALAGAAVSRSPRAAGAAAAAGASDSSRVLATAANALAADAEAAARQALVLEPRRASNMQRLANAFAMRGIAAAADSAFDAASRLAPFDALILVDRVRAEMQLGRPDAALATARRIVTMYPEEAMGHSLEASVWLFLGRAAEARAALDRALAARWEPEAEAQHAAAERFRQALGATDSSAIAPGAPMQR